LIGTSLQQVRCEEYVTCYFIYARLIADSLKSVLESPFNISNLFILCP